MQTSLLMSYRPSDPLNVGLYRGPVKPDTAGGTSTMTGGSGGAGGSGPTTSNSSASTTSRLGSKVKRGSKFTRRHSSASMANTLPGYTVASCANIG